MLACRVPWEFFFILFSFLFFYYQHADDKNGFILDVLEKAEGPLRHLARQRVGFIENLPRNGMLFHPVMAVKAVPAIRKTNEESKRHECGETGKRTKH